MIKQIKDNLNQINSLAQKNLKLRLRFKYRVIIFLISPIFSIIMPLIVMSHIFQFNESVGPWTKDNFVIFQILAYNI